MDGTGKPIFLMKLLKGSVSPESGITLRENFVLRRALREDAQSDEEKQEGKEGSRGIPNHR
jgi:hypothetical protein